MRRLVLILAALGAASCSRSFSVPYGVPIAPPRIRVQPVVRGATVDWQLVPGATRYDLCAATTPDPDVTTCVVSPTSVLAADVTPPHRLSLDPNQTWFVRVRASSPAGPATHDDSTASASVQVKPIPAGMAGLFPATGFDSIAGSTGVESLGLAVAIGDFDGDGFSDVAVGAPDPLAGPGSVVVEPAKDAPVASPLTLAGPSIGSQFGFALAAGDVDADGFDDLLVGAPRALDGGTQIGEAFLYRGGPQGLSTTPSFTAKGDPQEEFFGGAVALADVDGDGTADLLVGAMNHSETGLFHAGKIALFPAVGGVPATIPTKRFGSAADDNFGAAVADAGDVNGDGRHDLVIGAPGAETSGALNGEGAAYLYLGGSPLAATAAWQTFGGQMTAGWGGAVGGGDVDGDGLSDVVVGASAFDAAFLNGGRVAWFRGLSGTVPSTTPSWTADGASAGAAFGFALAVGDLNGDGFAETAVGAPADAALGKVSLFLGSAAGPPPAPTHDDAGTSNSALGAGLAIGRVDAGGASLLAEGAPNAGGNLGSVALRIGPPLEGPLADAGAPVRGKTGAVLTLTDPSASIRTPGDTLQCSIDWGDGSLPVAISGCLDLPGHTHIYTTAGSFTVRLTATDLYSLSGQGATTVTVTAP